MKPFRGQDGKYHILYKVTNLINQRFYIGIHSTRILNDGYLGSGKRIKVEIKKYGIKNFFIEHLGYFKNRQLLFLEETKIVNDDVLQHPLNLNITKGGCGDWSHINNDSNFSLYCKSKGGKTRAKNLTFEARSINSKKAHITKMENGFKFDLSHLISYWTGNSHREETKLKMSQTHKKNGHQCGDKNSQYGKMWIYNEESFESIRIFKNDNIPEGWKSGRKICKKL